MAYLNLAGIKKTYDGKEVVHGLDFHIEDGQFVVIVGPSGCGKSTLLRMIAGLEDISEGLLTINGEVMNDVDPSHRGCAMVFQNYALYPHMTVRQNIAYPLRISKVPRVERERRVSEAAAILAITDYLDRRPAQLSGGQRQRVAMGRAIVREPAVFLFDEPLSNLDAKLRVQMRIEIRRLHKRLNATSIFVTHDQVEAMTLADKLIVMNAGHIEQIGTPAEVYRRPQSAFVAGFMGAPAMNLAPATIVGRKRVGFDAAPNHEIAFDGTLSGGDGKVVLGIRPEDVVVSLGANGGLPATIDLIEELGGSRVAYCTVDGLELAVTLPAGEGDYDGRTVFLGFPSKALHLFDSITGKRLKWQPSTPGQLEPNQVYKKLSASSA